jgi:hypothetical protein
LDDPAFLRLLADPNGFLNAPIGSFFNPGGAAVNDPSTDMMSFDDPNAPTHTDQGYQFPQIPSGPKAGGGGGVPTGVGGGTGAGTAATTAAKTGVTVADTTGMPDWLKMLMQIGGAAASSAFAPMMFQPRQSFQGTGADPVNLLTEGTGDLRSLIAGLTAHLNDPVNLPSVQDPRLGLGRDMGRGAGPTASPSSTTPVRLPFASPGATPVSHPATDLMSGGAGPAGLDPQAHAAIQLLLHAAQPTGAQVRA